MLCFPASIWDVSLKAWILVASWEWTMFVAFRNEHGRNGNVAWQMICPKLVSWGQPPTIWEVLQHAMFDYYRVVNAKSFQTHQGRRSRNGWMLIQCMCLYNHHIYIHNITLTLNDTNCKLRTSKHNQVWPTPCRVSSSHRKHPYQQLNGQPFGSDMFRQLSFFCRRLFLFFYFLRGPIFKSFDHFDRRDFALLSRCIDRIICPLALIFFGVWNPGLGMTIWPSDFRQNHNTPQYTQTVPTYFKTIQTVIIPKSI